MVFTSPPRIPSRRVWKRLAFQEEILQKCVRKTPLWRTTTTLSNKVVLQRINWGARQQHCYCHTWDVQKKCRNSNEVVVAMSKQRRWKKSHTVVEGFFWHCGSFFSASLLFSNNFVLMMMQQTRDDAADLVDFLHYQNLLALCDFINGIR